MAIYNLIEIEKLSFTDRLLLNDQVQKVWDSQPCGLELVENPQDFIGKLTELKKIKNSDYPELYTKLRSLDLKGKKVLELGCGMGIDSEKLISLGAELTSVDLSLESCKIARAYLSQVFPYRDIKVYNVSSHMTNFENESFDFIYSYGSIHHSPLFPEICKEISNLLKPNGQALIMVYRRPSLMYWHAMKGREIDYQSPVSLFLTDEEFRLIMHPLQEVWRKNYYFLRPNISRLGHIIPKKIENIIGTYFGACQLVCFTKNPPPHI